MKPPPEQAHFLAWRTVRLGRIYNYRRDGDNYLTFFIKKHSDFCCDYVVLRVKCFHIDHLLRKIKNIWLCTWEASRRLWSLQQPVPRIPGSLDLPRKGQDCKSRRVFIIRCQRQQVQGRVDRARERSCHAHHVCNYPHPPEKSSDRSGSIRLPNGSLTRWSIRGDLLTLSDGRPPLWRTVMGRLLLSEVMELL